MSAAQDSTYLASTLPSKHKKLQLVTNSQFTQYGEKWCLNTEPCNLCFLYNVLKPNNIIYNSSELYTGNIVKALGNNNIHANSYDE